MGKIGASDIPIAMHLSPFAKRFDLLMQKTGNAVKPKASYAMQYGTKTEPKVLQMMIARTGRKFKSITFESKIFPWLVAQVDGCDGEILLEIKCPTSRLLYADALQGMIPPYYVAQMQTQMLVTGLKLCVFAVYYKQDLVTLECEADPLLQKKIVEASVEFLLDMPKVGIKSEPLRNALELYQSDLGIFSETLANWYQSSIQHLQTGLDKEQEYQGNLLDSMLVDHMTALPPQPAPAMQ